ncbi:MAG: septal ring lytic transglycosylase RlpA family protein [Saprospiraceae bacterium]
MKNYLMLILICMSFVATAQSNSGYASFIGDKFHGLKMANGETYNKNQLVAGHRSLPYGTKVKVTNTNNAKSIIVTIKDRGPFIKGGIIEISRKAGESIGMVYDKKVPVRIEVIGAGEVAMETEKKPAARSTTPSTYSENTTKGGSTKSTPKATPKPATKPTKPVVKAKPAAKPKAAVKTSSKSSGNTATATKTNTGVYKIGIQNVKKAGYGVQIGVFKDIDVVVYKVKDLTNKGFSDVYYTKSSNGYKIIIKNYSSYDQANAYKKALKAKYGINGFVVDFSKL